MNETREILIDEIKVGEHDQRLQINDESLDGLVSSIGRLGLVYPLVVRRQGDGFLLVEGHRRLASCKRLGLQKVLCSVKEVGQDRAAEIAFAGNFFRKDLSPVELAAAINDVLKSKAMTIEQIAEGFHRSVHWVNSMVAICSWPKDVQIAMHVEGMSIAAASNLACVTDDVYRKYLLENAVLGGVTARTTAAWLQAWRSSKPPEAAVETPPVQGAPPAQPLVPQAPCFFCSATFPVNQMSHVPLCGACIKQVRSII